MLKQSPLKELHLKKKARMTNFAGWEMPLLYPGGILAEQRACRTSCCLFDVSHMGQIEIVGGAATALLETLAPGNFIDLPAGRCLYSVFTNGEGGIEEDFVADLNSQRLRLVVNAANTDLALGLLEAAAKKLPGGKAGIELKATQGLVALQGPKAAKVMAGLASASQGLYFLDVAEMAILGENCLVSRSGYTGEDGFEISASGEHSLAIAQEIAALPEVTLAGLAARDGLRIEAGLCLHGSDIGPKTTPIEAGLAFVVNRQRRPKGERPGGYPGSAIIDGQMGEAAPERFRVGLSGKLPMRSGDRIALLGKPGEDGEAIGEVTSAGYSSALNKPIAQGYVKAKAVDKLEATRVLVGKKGRPAEINADPCFIKPNYRRR